jgi:hypothetical protein
MPYSTLKIWSLKRKNAESSEMTGCHRFTTFSVSLADEVEESNCVWVGSIKTKKGQRQAALSIY